MDLMPLTENFNRDDKIFRNKDISEIKVIQKCHD